MKFTLISNIFEPHVRGGYELGCATIGQRLQSLGHEVAVLTSQSPGVLEKTAATSGLMVHRIFEPVFEYEEHLCGVFARSGLWQRRVDSAFGGVIAANVIALHHFLAGHPADVIWLFNPLGLGPVGIAEAVAAQRGKCLVHFMDHIDDTVAAHQHFHHYLGRWRRNKKRLTAISCSKKIRRSNEQLGNYRQHHVIYNGFSPSDLPTMAPRLPDAPMGFLYFGQLSREKGLPQVVQSFAAFARRRPQLECRLDLIGRGSEAFENELRGLIQRERLAGRVRCLGFMPKTQLLGRLPEYDAAVMLLNNAEPFAFSPLEAASAGVPVILTAETGNAEVFPRDYPLLVPDRDDLAGVVNKMEWCAAHRGELRPCAEKLWQHLAARCHLDRVTMPAYLQAIAECPQNDGPADLSPLLAASATVDFYSQFQ